MDYKGLTTSRYFYHYLFWIIIFLSYFVDSALLLHFNVFLFFMNFFLKNGLLIAIVYLNLRILMPVYLEKRYYFSYFTWILIIIIVATLAINVLEFNSWEAFYQRLFEGTPLPDHHVPLHEKDAPQAAIGGENKVDIRMNMTGTRKIMLDLLTVCRYLVISVLLKFIDDFFNQREVLNKMQVEKTTAELNYLKAQVNPHFLFNTLNNIYGLTLENPTKAGETVLKLSDMMKYMLTEGDSDTVLLSKDLENLKHYVGIERLRIREDSNIRFEISGNIKSQRIIPLLLLPLIENAFKHGVNRSIANSFLDAVIHVEDKMLFMVIKNNIPPNSVGIESLGIGIQNVKKRLDLFYKGKHKLEVNEIGQIFTVQLEISLI